MAKRAIKNINWGAIAERIAVDEKAAFAAFKTKSDQYLRKVQEYPEHPPKIDWAFYKQSIAIPGFVDKFQKEYESVQIPYPQDKYTSAIDELEKKAAEDVKKQFAEWDDVVKECEEKVKHIKSLIPYGEMTMEDFKDAHPDIAHDPFNRPSIYPHTPEFQPDEDGGEPCTARSGH